MTLRLTTALLIGALALTGCSGDDGSTPNAQASTPASAVPSASALASQSPTPFPTPSSTLPAGVDVLIRATVSNGKVQTDAALVSVTQGAQVRLVVTSDVADEIHLHTYDKSVKVPAGGTATLDFTATLTGTFEVELEKRELRLLRIRIR